MTAVIVLVVSRQPTEGHHRPHLSVPPCPALSGAFERNQPLQLFSLRLLISLTVPQKLLIYIQVQIFKTSAHRHHAHQVRSSLSSNAARLRGKEVSRIPSSSGYVLTYIFLRLQSAHSYWKGDRARYRIRLQGTAYRLKKKRFISKNEQSDSSRSYVRIKMADTTGTTNRSQE